MIDVTKKVYFFLNEKRIKVPELAAKIGMSKAGLYQSLKKDRLTVDALIKIADVLNVPVTDFFEQSSTELSVKQQWMELRGITDPNTAEYFRFLEARLKVIEQFNHLRPIEMYYHFYQG